MVHLYQILSISSERFVQSTWFFLTFTKFYLGSVWQIFQFSKNCSHWVLYFIFPDTDTKGQIANKLWSKNLLIFDINEVTKLEFWWKLILCFPNFGSQATRLEIFNLGRFIFQKVCTIGFWTKFSKFGTSLKIWWRHQNIFPKIWHSYHELTPLNFKSIAISDDDMVGTGTNSLPQIFWALKSLAK